MCYSGCYYYPCIHTPGAYSYGPGSTWSTSGYSSTSSTSTGYPTIADEESLRWLRNRRRSRRTDDEVYNVSVRYRSGSRSGRSRSRSFLDSPSMSPGVLLPSTYYAFVPASSRRRLRVSVYE
ncbi:uncharacterized protein SPSK_03739 [Sporothrix schenckii 1099-18]|uniref:Uncharacterized protein n=2 Tax=Sporothrix schenckii TaxID=29908 RepID=U7PX96_SPOS1|nr:uncharacterized protein SPSK_03739 [Sporothrix schenckii 1099-18]ERS99546.1 hypothetical protein HMPREF1624_04751 [Sporothrix schenckii ATCC 58251]KJR82709.1 hypothetical protein SPSK_03739 [Sporothrix schenckii 1099-18]